MRVEVEYGDEKKWEQEEAQDEIEDVLNIRWLNPICRSFPIIFTHTCIVKLN